MSLLQLGCLLNGCSHLDTILALSGIKFLGFPRGDAVVGFTGPSASVVLRSLPRNVPSISKFMQGTKCERSPPKLGP